MEASTFERICEVAAQQQIKRSSVVETAVMFYLDVAQASEPSKIHSTYALLDQKLKRKGWKVEHTFEAPQ